MIFATPKKLADYGQSNIFENMKQLFVLILKC